MKKIKITGILTYDNKCMHGNDSEAIARFHHLLEHGDLTMHKNKEIGDSIGKFRIHSYKYLDEDMKG